MSMVGIFLIGALFLILIIAVYIISLYNSLVTKTKLSEEGWSGIDVALKRRYDLIPNLVSVVKGYAKHEQDTLSKVIAQRNLCGNSKNIDERMQNENILSGMLKSVFALSEAYPELKADKNFLELQKSLTEIEENLSMARRYYNATVRELNIMIDAFPSNIVAKRFGFNTKPFYTITDEAERQNVKIIF